MEVVTVVNTENKSVQVLLRLPIDEVKKFDKLVKQLKAKSRNQAMSIILDSSFGIPAKVETLPSNEEEVHA